MTHIMRRTGLLYLLGAILVVSLAVFAASVLRKPSARRNQMPCRPFSRASSAAVARARVAASRAISAQRPV